jgi:hypothetical protein
MVKKSRIAFLLAIAFLIVLVLAVIFFTDLGTSTQARVPGVAVGDTFVYDVTSFWNPSAPNAVVPQRLLDINQTESFKVTITDISGAMVTTRDTWIFKNGTEHSATGIINVETGYNFGGFWAVVAANLRKNDLLHPAGQNRITVNGTINKQYLSGTRETNYFTLTYQGLDETYGYYDAETEYYFDRATGMLAKLYDKSEFHSANMECAILWTLKESSVWTV